MSWLSEVTGVDTRMEGSHLVTTGRNAAVAAALAPALIGPLSPMLGFTAPADAAAAKMTNAQKIAAYDALAAQNAALTQSAATKKLVLYGVLALGGAVLLYSIVRGLS